MEPRGCTLRAGRKGVLTKTGEFTMISVEQPNLSNIAWVRFKFGELLTPCGCYSCPFLTCAALDCR